MYMTLVPAYGRDYKNAKEVKAAWSRGDDFVIQCVMSPDDGRYVSVRDADALKSAGHKINIRYKKLTQILPITL